MKIDWETISLKNLAGFISKELEKEGIDVILVGGACVTIYSNNIYQSYDLDFIIYEDLRKVEKALHPHGFEYKSKCFVHKECPWVIEFVSPPVAVGGELIYDFAKTKTKMGTVKMLRPIDCIKDRLASFYHWNDRQGLEQAIDVSISVKNIDIEELRHWSGKEGFTKEFEEYLSLYEIRKT